MGPFVHALPARLDQKNLNLMCLHIKFATLSAQRENTSYGALLAAQQSWETWYRDAYRVRNAWFAPDDENLLAFELTLDVPDLVVQAAGEEPVQSRSGSLVAPQPRPEAK